MSAPPPIVPLPRAAELIQEGPLAPGAPRPAITVGARAPAAPRPPTGRLRARVVPAPSIGPALVERMYALFADFYDNTSLDRFRADLATKQRVILLSDGGSGEVQGFCTLRDLECEVDGRRVYGLFTGDTIIAPAYWGQSALSTAFFGCLVRGKLRHPLCPYYWFLISKGYKTYLTLTNNIFRHYPRYERPTPAWEQRVLDRFARDLYPTGYDPATGCIDCGVEHERLREGVAPITPAMRAAHPRIDFFARRNPRWEEGAELCCIGELSWHVPALFPARVVWKALRALAGGRRRRERDPAR